MRFKMTEMARKWDKEVFEMLNQPHKDLTGRQTHRNRTSQEDDVKGKKTLQEEYHTMEEDLNGRRPKWKITSIKDELNGRQPQLKTPSIYYNV